jgi:hypothetical protein
LRNATRKRGSERSNAVDGSGEATTSPFRVIVPVAVFACDVALPLQLRFSVPVSDSRQPRTPVAMMFSVKLEL